MSLIYDWAIKWGVSLNALHDLQVQLTAAAPSTPHVVKSEAAVQQDIRLEWPKRGGRMWRNNVGAAFTKDGRPVRYGLNNDSKKINSVSKSGDLIGITPLLIQPIHIGHNIGVFTSIEVKKSGWVYNPTNEKEHAQFNWACLITSLGGYATFATTTEGLYETFKTKR